jgi:hypothetical protein
MRRDSVPPPFCSSAGWRRNSVRTRKWQPKIFGFRKTQGEEAWHHHFTSRTGGEPVTSCKVTTEEAEFRIVHKLGADLLDVSFGHALAAGEMEQVLPAGSNDPVALAREG